jgi:ElaB/YqjD/DUF883 family membrane-anchored ribosome-binding protein
MAKNKKTSTDSPTPDSPTAASPTAAATEPAKVRVATEAVRCAEAELEKARDFCRKVQEEATEQIKSARQKTVGDLIDGTLAAVKKHPAAGLGMAAVIGFFLGRLFRR